MEAVNGKDISQHTPPEHARELQLIKLEGNESDFEFTIRHPAQFAAAWMHVEPSNFVDAATNERLPPKMTPVIAFDSCVGGRDVKKHIVLVPFGRNYATKPDFHLSFLGSYLDPRTRFPVAVYEVLKPLTVAS
jgi:hypothetical protein